LTPVVDDGLGDSAYLVNLGDGRALALDPPRTFVPCAARPSAQG
jgi:hydroxyacylglutathione hydrolase